jgi:magnesium chelatase subunit D
MPEAVERTPPVLDATRAIDHPANGGRSPAWGRTGRTIRSTRWDGEHQTVAVLPTALAVAEHRAERPDGRLRPEDLRSEVHEHKTGNLVVVAVDTSGSMGAEQRLAAARGAVLGLLADAYRRRDRVALIAVGGTSASLVLRPTGSVEVATSRLADLPVGGGTPLADGLRTIARTVEPSLAGAELQPIIVLITDGRATVGDGDPLDDARTAARDLARHRVPTVVVDAESGMPRLGLATTLADDLGAEVVTLGALGDGELVEIIRAQSDGGRS